MRGRSACDWCKATLSARELIPVLSYILQRGKCRRCGAAITPDHLVIELGAAGIGAAALAASPDAAGLAGALFGWLLLTLAALDIRHFWLPDILTGSLAAGGLASGLLNLPPDLANRLWGGFAGFVSLFLVALLYRLIRKRDGMGGGDPKLLGAIGLWLGWQALPIVLVAASAVGLGWAAAQGLRGKGMSATGRLPLGALMALAAFPVWIAQQ